MPQIQLREIPINPMNISDPIYEEDSDTLYEEFGDHITQIFLKTLKITSISLFLLSLGFYALHIGTVWFPILFGVLAITLNRWWIYLLTLFLIITYGFLVLFYLKVVYDHFLDNPIYWASLLLLGLILIIGYIGYQTIQEWRVFLGRW